MFWGGITDEGMPILKTEPLGKYRHVHYLVTVDIDDHDRFVPLIDQLRDMGAEVKETRNDT